MHGTGKGGLLDSTVRTETHSIEVIFLQHTIDSVVIATFCLVTILVDDCSSCNAWILNCSFNNVLCFYQCAFNM